MSVKHNFQEVQASIEAACNRANRRPEDIHIVAVTKYVTIDKAKEAVQAGIVHLGENRTEEGLEKWEAIGDDVSWHFIGNLQSRKVKNMIHAFDYIHSLDRLSLAKELNKRLDEERKIKCFVQVNVTGEESKSGIEPQEVVSFIEELKKYPAVEVVGLMTMAPYVENTESLRPAFRHLRELKETVEQKQWLHAPCHELSMGMSNDYEIAVEEGATFIRIGSLLVGKDK
ncbi:YggS family pyridoxal phosphate-dependent enzyme [Salipaludibacillus daqingensis]|uniref:YggS family pyridoxal phosphate-dependent enzyme n=1 Tax=Salipaludibacillus daqingensis TaxID=3041001 RepID=UPI0024771D10|nr:YggS family pyridoxal phosphate-dependent enzyme [Salipaludibacillus daqingensis]